MSETLKERVRAYWQAEPCGTSTTEAAPGTREFYADVERRRYELEPFIPGAWGSEAYTQRELDSLFAGFSEVPYGPLVTPYDRLVGGQLAARLPRRFGWFVGIVAKR